MSAKSKIEWTDATFNPWIGCTKVSPGCANCYAESEDKRRGWTAAGWGKGKPRKRTSDSYWKQPRRWNADPAKLIGDQCLHRRPRVFCASLADWLDDEVPIEWLADLLALIHATPNLDWLLLTKRPENFAKRQSLASTVFFQRGDNDNCSRADAWVHGRAPRNVWIGTSAEDQQRWDERVAVLAQIPARVRFVSCEPLLGSIDLRRLLPFVHWVIVGGESGSNARECNVRWPLQVVSQCRKAGVHVFLKQLGAYVVDRNDAGYDGESTREWPMGTDTRDIDSGYQGAPVRVLLSDRKGGDWNEWPEALRVREFPLSSTFNVGRSAFDVCPSSPR